MGFRRIALGLAVTISLAAAPGIVSPSAAGAATAQVQDHEKAVQTFTGTIVKSGEKYTLEDSTTKTSYQLDDPQKASAFNGKKVKVVGTLDAEKKLIHVEM